MWGGARIPYQSGWWALRAGCSQLSVAFPCAHVEGNFLPTANPLVQPGHAFSPCRLRATGCVPTIPAPRPRSQLPSGRHGGSIPPPKLAWRSLQCCSYALVRGTVLGQERQTDLPQQEETGRKLICQPAPRASLAPREEEEEPTTEGPGRGSR